MRSIADSRIRMKYGVLFLWDQIPRTGKTESLT